MLKDVRLKSKPFSSRRAVSITDIKKSHANGASRGINNLLLKQSDTWSQIHGKQVPTNISTNHPLGLSSRTSFRDLAGFSKPKQTLISNHSTTVHKEDVKYLAKMRRESSQQKIVCLNGVKCKNHDWDRRSPIVKVCTRGPNCDNHDWNHVDRQDSPFRVVCRRGPNCMNHDWDHRSPMRKLAKRNIRTRIIQGQPIPADPPSEKKA